MKKRLISYIKDNPYAKFSDLAAIFDGKKNDLVLLLNDLVNEGELVFEDNTYITPFSLGLVRAVVVSVKSTYAFLNIAEDEDVTVEEQNLNGALLGDIVYLKHNVMFKVVKIVKRSRSEVVGEIVKTNSMTTLKVKSIATSNITFFVNNYEGLNSQIVRASIIKYSNNSIFVDIVEVLGSKNAPGVDITRILLEHDCPLVFNEEVENQVVNIPLSIENEDHRGRTDLRNEFIVTIDGEDAKDLDDAVSVRRKNNGYEVGIHIADVSHYVTYSSPLDKEAFNRGTSIYVTDRVVPMLPFELSNGICSLNPNVDRFAMSCVVQLDESGKTISSQIFPSIIKTKHRLTYTYVNEIIENKDASNELNETIQLLNEVAIKLRELKKERGCLDLSIPEIKVIVDETGKPINIEKRLQKDGEKLIEDLMILANETVAETISKRKLPFIYRIHENPAAKRIDNLISFTTNMGFKPKFNALNVTPLAVQKLLLDVAKSEKSTVIAQVLLRSLAKARYSPHNKGHFGLASTCYTHFTSPIRRYPDLIVHRLLKDYLIFNEVGQLKTKGEELAVLAENASFKERRAITVEREATDMKCAEYMTQFIGDTFKGFIAGMTNSGLFVDLENGVSGKLRFEDMYDFYRVDDHGQRAYGRRGKSFNLGDNVEVILLSANKDNGEIVLQLKSENDKLSKNRTSPRDFYKKRRK